MKVYVASSWRNQRQQAVVAALREAGHDVYDFRNPGPGDTGFSWKQCATDTQLKDPDRFRKEVLSSPIAKKGFAKDMAALSSADATVLVLPCGRSAHLELGYATGAGQKTVVLFDAKIDEPELMYLMNTHLCVSMYEVLAVLNTQQDISAGPYANLYTEVLPRFIAACRVTSQIDVPDRADARLWFSKETCEAIDKIGRKKTMYDHDKFNQEVREVLDEVAVMLARKNEAYGDSALNPVRIFSRTDTVEQLKVRIDDKLSRLARGDSDGEDVEWDLLGYLVMLRIAKQKRASQEKT